MVDMPAVAGKLQLALGEKLEKFMASPTSSDIILLTPSGHGTEKADMVCIEKHAEVIGALFKLFNGKLPANQILSDALHTLDRTFDGKLTERFIGATKGAFVAYEVEKLRMLHSNAMRVCRRARKSRDYPRINALRNTFQDNVKSSASPDGNSPDDDKTPAELKSLLQPETRQATDTVAHAVQEPKVEDSSASCPSCPAPGALDASTTMQQPLKVVNRRNLKKQKVPKKKKIRLTKKTTPKAKATPKDKATPKANVHAPPGSRYAVNKSYQRKSWIVQVKDTVLRRAICQVTEKQCLRDHGLAQEVGEFLAALINQGMSEVNVLTVRARLIAGRSVNIDGVDFDLGVLARGMGLANVVDLEDEDGASSYRSLEKEFETRTLQRNVPPVDSDHDGESFILPRTGIAD